MSVNQGQRNLICAHTDKNNQKTKFDWYIFGHPRHIKFDSFAQLALHLNTLQLQQPPGNCTCKVCKKHPLTDEDPIIEDPAPATMVTLAGDPAAPEDVAAVKDKSPPISNDQTEAGPSILGAAQSSSEPFPTQFLEEESAGPSGSAPSALASRFLPDKRFRPAVNYAEYTVVNDDDSDADVTSGGLDNEDDESESTAERDGRAKQGKRPALSAKAAGKRPEKRVRSSKAAGKRPEKRPLSSTARGKQPTKVARIDDEDPTDVDQEVGDPMNVNQEEKDLGAEGAQVVLSDGESIYDSDFPEFEDSVPDPDVLYYQELLAKVKALHIERLFTRLKMEKTQRLFGPMTQVLDTVSAASYLYYWV